MKQFRIIVLLVVFLLGMEITSFGDTKIENVELSFSVGQEPAAGDDVLFPHERVPPVSYKQTQMYGEVLGG